MPVSIDQVRSALSCHQPRLLEPEPDQVQAAVALVLAGAGADLSLCFIRRAEHPLDPWSGHMALPGGRVDPTDPSPQAAAERETLEEVGLALSDPHRIGPLSHLPIRLGGRTTPMVLSPFVYDLGEDLVPFTINHEVAEAYWIPLSYLWDAKNAGHHQFEWNGARLSYPAIRFRDSAIWGLTFRVLTQFSDVLDLPLPHLEEIPRAGTVATGSRRSRP